MTSNLTAYSHAGLEQSVCPSLDMPRGWSEYWYLNICLKED